MDIFMPHTKERSIFGVTDKPINSQHTEPVRAQERGEEEM